MSSSSTRSSATCFSHTTLDSWDLFILLHVASVCSSWLLYRIPLRQCAIINLWYLGIEFGFLIVLCCHQQCCAEGSCAFPWKNVQEFFWNEYLGAELVDHRTHITLSLRNNAKSFPKGIVPMKNSTTSMFLLLHILVNTWSYSMFNLFPNWLHHCGFNYYY